MPSRIDKALLCRAPFDAKKRALFEDSIPWILRVKGVGGYNKAKFVQLRDVLLRLLQMQIWTFLRRVFWRTVNVALKVLLCLQFETKLIFCQALLLAQACRGHSDPKMVWCGKSCHHFEYIFGCMVSSETPPRYQSCYILNIFKSKYIFLWMVSSETPPYQSYFLYFWMNSINSSI